MIELKQTEKKDHYKLTINGVELIVEQERSFYRELIQVIDNGISN